MPLFGAKKQTRRVPIAQLPEIVKNLTAILEEQAPGHWRLKTLELKPKVSTGHRVIVTIEQVQEIDGNASIILALPAHNDEDDVTEVSDLSW